MNVIATVYGPDGYIAEHPTGGVIMLVVDNEDGTGTRTCYDTEGEVLSTDQFDVEPPQPLSPGVMFDQLDPLLAKAVVELAAGLIGQAGELWEALTQVEEENTAKPTLDIIVSTTLDAALPLIES